jgi:hypothetical protein
MKVRPRRALIGAEGLATVGGPEDEVEGLRQAAVKAGAAGDGEGGEGLAVDCTVVDGVRLACNRTGPRPQ